MQENQVNNTPGTSQGLGANLARGKKAFRIFIIAVILILVITLSVLFLTRHDINTDNAMVQADVLPVAARVGGLVSQVLIADNQTVRKGDAIIQLDDTDFAARLAQSEADLQVAQAQLESAIAQAKVLTAAANADNSAKKNGLTSLQAAVARAAAQKRNAELDLTRTRNLFASGAVSQSQLDNSQTAFDVAKANLDQTQAALAADADQRRSAQAQVSLATARVKSATAALELAKNQLSYTTVVAAADGRVSKLSVHPGQLIVAGQTVAELVPAYNYVVANFKEIQIRKINIGDKVLIKVDAYPGKRFYGEVESISGGTGSIFSLLPPDNASGNYIKVVQRIPVRIRLQQQEGGPALLAGMSVKVTVYSNQKFAKTR